MHEMMGRLACHPVGFWTLCLASLHYIMCDCTLSWKQGVCVCGGGGGGDLYINFTSAGVSDLSDAKSKIRTKAR